MRGFLRRRLRSENAMQTGMTLVVSVRIPAFIYLGLWFLHQRVE